MSTFEQKFKIYIENLNSFQKDNHKIDIDSNTKPYLPFNRLTPFLCEGFKDFLLDTKRSHLSGETPNDYWKRFKGVVKLAYQENYLVKNPTEGIVFHGNKGKSNRLIKDVLSSDELKLLANTDCVNPEVKRAFLFSCFTGLGESEIRKLTWGNIKNGKLIIGRSKNSEQISLKLHPDVIALVGEPEDTITHIFSLPSNVTVSKHLKRWVKDAGIDKKISYYCARHSFAVNILLGGANIKTVADCLGHSSLKYVTRYLNYVDGLKDDAINNLKSIF